MHLKTKKTHIEPVFTCTTSHILWDQAEGIQVIFVESWSVARLKNLTQLLGRSRSRRSCLSDTEFRIGQCSLGENEEPFPISNKTSQVHNSVDKTQSGLVGCICSTPNNHCSKHNGKNTDGIWWRLLSQCDVRLWDVLPSTWQNSIDSLIKIFFTFIRHKHCLHGHWAASIW